MIRRARGEGGAHGFTRSRGATETHGGVPQSPSTRHGGPPAFGPATEGKRCRDHKHRREPDVLVIPASLALSPREARAHLDEVIRSRYNSVRLRDTVTPCETVPSVSSVSCEYFTEGGDR
jgi:hypothetical protein